MGENERKEKGVRVSRVFLLLLFSRKAVLDYKYYHKLTKVIYMCSSLLDLAVESCDLSQAEKEITVVTSRANS